MYISNEIIIIPAKYCVFQGIEAELDHIDIVPSAVDKMKWGNNRSHECEMEEWQRQCYHGNETGL